MIDTSLIDFQHPTTDINQFRLDFITLSVEEFARKHFPVDRQILTNNSNGQYNPPAVFRPLRVKSYNAASFSPRRCRVPFWVLEAGRRFFSQEGVGAGVAISWRKTKTRTRWDWAIPQLQMTNLAYNNDTWIASGENRKTLMIAVAEHTIAAHGLGSFYEGVLRGPIIAEMGVLPTVCTILPELREMAFNYLDDSDIWGRIGVSSSPAKKHEIVVFLDEMINFDMRRRQSNTLKTFDQTARLIRPFRHPTNK
jgi:hypothetical protein